MDEHQSLTSQRVGRELQFEHTVVQLTEAVHRSGGALPSAGSTDRDVVRLARWLAKRRWEANRGILSPKRVRALDAAVPRWRESTHSKEGFEATLAECASWRAAHGRLPRSRGGDERETRLGQWLVARRYDARIDRLRAFHAELLDVKLAGWL